MKLLSLAFLLAVFTLDVSAQEARRPSVAVVDFGESEMSRALADDISATLKKEGALDVIDRDAARAAAHGAGYAGSLNLSLDEARLLGQTLGVDFFVLGDAQTLRRSPSSGPIYFESYASVFVVSSRTGRLLFWDRPNFRGKDEKSALDALRSDILRGALAKEIVVGIRRGLEDERAAREVIVDRETPVIEEAPGDEKTAEAEGLRLPKPFRRFVPAYPASAAAAEAEAIVDVLIDLDNRGEITRAQIVRWAGFGLDEATLDTVQKLHFFPAMRDGVAVPIRVLLRYNFRKPPV